MTVTTKSRTATAIVRAVGAVTAIGVALLVVAGPAAADDGPSSGMPALDSLGWVSLDAQNNQSVTLAIQVTADPDRRFSASLHAGSPEKYDQKPVATLDDVVGGTSITTLGISPDVFRPYAYVVVLSVDGKVAGTAGIGRWGWQDGIGRWDIGGR
jgi:hypothetical protein